MHVLTGALLALAACAAPMPTRPALLQSGLPWGGSLSHTSFALGYKRAAPDWSPARDHAIFGLIDVDARGPGWPVAFAAQALLTFVDSEPEFADGVADNAGTYELNVGLRKVWRRGQVEPFVGGGLSLLGASVSDFRCFDTVPACFQDQRDDDTTLGWWVGAGLFWDAGPARSYGVHLQVSQGELELLGEDVQAGGVSLLFTYGLRR